MTDNFAKVVLVEGRPADAWTVGYGGGEFGVGLSVKR